MATAGIAPRDGVDADDLRDLGTRPGPFLTIHLRTEPDVEHAGVLVEHPWKALRRLAADGDRQVRLVGALDGPLDDDLATWTEQGASMATSHSDEQIEGPR